MLQASGRLTDTSSMRRRIEVAAASVVAASVLVGNMVGFADAGQKVIPIPMCRTVRVRQSAGRWTLTVGLRNRTSRDNRVRGVWRIEGATVDHRIAAARVPPRDQVRVVLNLGPARHKPVAWLRHCSDWKQYP
jgi:hypothetical protein